MENGDQQVTKGASRGGMEVLCKCGSLIAKVPQCYLPLPLGPWSVAAAPSFWICSLSCAVAEQQQPAGCRGWFFWLDSVSRASVQESSKALCLCLPLVQH